MYHVKVSLEIAEVDISECRYPATFELRWPAIGKYEKRYFDFRKQNTVASYLVLVPGGSRPGTTVARSSYESG